MTGIKQGDYKLLLCSPQALLEDFWLDVLAEEDYSSKICLFCIDEAHNIEEWKDFRPSYKSLIDIKCCIASAAPILLLTATCSDTMYTDIIKSLDLDTIDVVATVPDR